MKEGPNCFQQSLRPGEFSILLMGINPEADAVANAIDAYTLAYVNTTRAVLFHLKNGERIRLLNSLRVTAKFYFGK